MTTATGGSTETPWFAQDADAVVAAVAPKPVTVVVHDYDESIRALADLGVRRCSVGASLAGRAWASFEEAATALKRAEA